MADPLTCGKKKLNDEAEKAGTEKRIGIQGGSLKKRQLGGPFEAKMRLKNEVEKSLTEKRIQGGPLK